jgi:hypothetical protein
MLPGSDEPVTFEEDCGWSLTYGIYGNCARVERQAEVGYGLDEKRLAA